MSITVRDVLKLQEWKGCKVVAGEDGLSREVLYIDNMEVPDIVPWLKKNELLITTGYAIHKNEEVLVQLIHALSENECAGIALKTKFIGEITDEMKKIADIYQIPLIVIPQDVPTIQLTNPLMKMIVDEQNYKLEFSKDMNEKFLAIQIEGGSFPEMGTALGELLNCKVVITDEKFNCMGIYPEHLLAEAGWPELYQKLQSVPLKEKDGVQKHRTEKEEIWGLGIWVKSSCSGYLYIIGSLDQFDEMSEIACMQAAVHFAFEFSKRGVKDQDKYYKDNNFFMDLISDNVVSEEDALRRGRGLYWPQFPYRLAVSDIDNFESVIHDKAEEEIQTIKDTIMQIQKDILRKEGCFFIGNKSDSFHCLFVKQTDTESIREAMNKVQRQVQKALGITVTVGVSRKIASFSEFKRAYRETRTAVKIGKKKGKHRVCFIEEERMEEAFYEMTKMNIFKKYVSDSLEILEEYDQKHGSYLVETVKVLTENLGARKETADALYLHRNTLTHRIRRIEQLIGEDLDDPEVLFSLYLAVKIRTYMER